MKNLIIAVMLICGLVFSPMAIAQESGAKIVLPDGQEVPLGGLNNSEQQSMINYLNKIAKHQKDNAPKPIVNTIQEADPDQIEKWSKLVTNTVKTVCTDLGIAVNEFIVTPAGIIITSVIVYNLAGKDMIVGGKVIVSDIMDVVLGIPMWFTIMLLLLYLQRRYLGMTTVYDINEYKEDDKKPEKVTRIEKSNPKRVHRYKWTSADSRTTFSCFLYGTGLVVTFVVVLLIFL